MARWEWECPAGRARDGVGVVVGAAGLAVGMPAGSGSPSCHFLVADHRFVENCGSVRLDDPRQPGRARATSS
jgi:hypothetical protein